MSLLAFAPQPNTPLQQYPCPTLLNLNAFQMRVCLTSRVGLGEKEGYKCQVNLDWDIEQLQFWQKNRMDKLPQSKGSSYRLSQMFGYKGPNEKIVDEDVISVIKFDPTGKLLSVGDKAGRIIMFQAIDSNKKKEVEYEYYAEFQSHAKEFDPLRSMDIEEEITGITWMRPQGKYMKMLTCNSKSIKLWKIYEKTEKKVVRSAGKELTMPKLQAVESAINSQLVQTLPNKHLSNVNSISTTNNQQYMLSSDDVHAYLWGLDNPERPYVAVDLLGNDKIEDVKENITFSKLHPTSDSLFIYGTNKGSLKLSDLRISSQSDNAMSFKSEMGSQQKNFITDMIASYSSGEFMRNGKYIATRDYLTVKVWDVCNCKKPVQTVMIQEGVKGKLCEMFENEAIFDKFSLSCSSDSNTIVTGNYNNSFHMLDLDNNSHTQYELNYKKATLSKPILNAKMPILPKIDYQRKTNACDFNPKKNIAAVASLNCFFIYSM